MLPSNFVVMYTINGKVIDLKHGKKVIMIVTMGRGQWSISLIVCLVSAVGIALPFSKLSGSAKWG